jgi:hypothetical protein
VLYTWSSSTIPSLPPPKTTIKSLIATALWPCLGRGHGPVVLVTRFHFRMGAAIFQYYPTCIGKMTSARTYQQNICIIRIKLISALQLNFLSNITLKQKYSKVFLL